MKLYRLDNLKIVVVDDQANVRCAVGRFLSDKGARVQACQNVDEALDVIFRLQPNLIISDIRMPEKDGFELLSAVRSLNRDSSREVPVIAMTDFKAEKLFARRPRFDGFLPKPFTPAALMRAISDVLT
jgi:CheY-like chemotaxis protein